MTSIRDLQAWLYSMEPDDLVGVEGNVLVVVTPEGYGTGERIEVGGFPEGLPLLKPSILDKLRPQSGRK